jgi:hypothetical protein
MFAHGSIKISQRHPVVASQNGGKANDAIRKHAAELAAHAPDVTLASGARSTKSGISRDVDFKISSWAGVCTAGCNHRFKR